MDPLVLNAMIPGTSVDEDSADISSKSTPAGMDWSGLQIRWAGGDSDWIMWVPLASPHLALDTSNYLQEFSKTKTCESQTPKTAVNFLDFRDVLDVVSGKQRLKAYQAVAANLQSGLWV
ncbi:MAG: hypothetical protein LQ348_005353 [Seirophora lacunosa]|nr:MAG: hypothetical protein LQ348_005353 [Seirophora lacunosa]